MTFSEMKNYKMVMTAIFMLCSRKRKWIRSNVTESEEKNVRKGWYAGYGIGLSGTSHRSGV